MGPLSIAAPLQDVFYPLDLFLPELVTQIQSDLFTGNQRKVFDVTPTLFVLGTFPHGTFSGSSLAWAPSLE